MKKVLYMHAGSGNHGCEAIVRTIANLLNGPNDLVLWSWDKPEDYKYGVAALVEKVVASEELSRFSLPYFEAQIKRRLLKNDSANKEVFLKHLFKGNIAISIGGDNYCYEWSAQQAIELDQEIRKYCSHTVLWGCSIEEDALTQEMRDDLSKYDLITARESITYECLKKFNPNTVLVADPAFLLEKRELPLPDGFQKDNTVGINISPLIMKYSEGDSIVLNNYETLIRYIINETNMNVCFIPHVVWDHNNDLVPINALYEIFKNTGRVCKIDDGNCMELKGYIARCRFFVGARTHATIAAYSSCIPTLVIGYSVKSKGIARDLFGTEKQYVLPVQELITPWDLTNHFTWLMKNENAIRTSLETVIPEYEKKARCSIDAFYKMSSENK